jgi:hypothetical protein
LFNDQCRREDEGVVTEPTPCRLFPDHLETAEVKRQTAQELPVNLIDGQSA